jgi:isocitrate dehydrogenase
MSTKLNPVVFANGDQTAGMVAELVATSLFSQFPLIRIPCTIEDRLRTNDACITAISTAMKQYRAGVKISTGTDDPRILSTGLGSANIKLREQMGVIGMLRMITEPRGYKKPCAIFRYGSGGFYEESRCETVIENGVEHAVVTSHMNITNLAEFARLAMEIASKYQLDIHVSSKWTIAPSEKIFADRITEVFDAAHFPYHKDLTDVGLARVATDKIGGWLWLFDNPNGDSASDVVDWVDGTRSMTSTLMCRGGIEYEEMPGGTAPDKLETDLHAENFFNPIGIIGCFAKAITTVNPDQKSRMQGLLTSAQIYLHMAREHEQNTYDMIGYIAEVAAKVAA